MSFKERIKGLKIILKLQLRDKKKFNVGSGFKTFKGDWFCTDYESLDITKPSEWKKYLPAAKLDNIMAEHVWEHLTDEATALANENCFRFLKKNGRLRLAVPDGLHPDKEYIDYVKPGGHGYGADDHKILYDYRIMRSRLEKAGFKVELLEYWDEHGKFHYVDWDDEAGHITRSRRYDKRNQGGELKYTSLIVDAIKQ